MAEDAQTPQDHKDGGITKEQVVARAWEQEWPSEPESGRQ